MISPANWRTVSRNINSSSESRLNGAVCTASSATGVIATGTSLLQIDAGESRNIACKRKSVAGCDEPWHLHQIRTHAHKFLLDGVERHKYFMHMPDTPKPRTPQ